MQLRVGVGYEGECLGGDVIHVVECQRGTAPDALFVNGEHDFLLVSGEFVTAHFTDVDSPVAEAVEVVVGNEHIDSFSGSEAVAFDAAALHNGVVVALGHSGVAGHAARVEFEVVPDVFDCDFLRLAECDKCEGQHQC